MSCDCISELSRDDLRLYCYSQNERTFKRLRIFTLHVLSKLSRLTRFFYLAISIFRVLPSSPPPAACTHFLSSSSDAIDTSSAVIRCNVSGWVDLSALFGSDSYLQSAPKMLTLDIMTRDATAVPFALSSASNNYPSFSCCRGILSCAIFRAQWNALADA